MPLIRYRIGDQGVLEPPERNERHSQGQVFKSILGRNGDMFKLKNGGLVGGCYFSVLLYHKDWIKEYQVVQNSVSSITFRIVKTDPDSGLDQQELDEITAKTRLGMGRACEVNFEFVQEMSANPSGKYRYIICEVPDR